jgi:lipopolysaccharide biosynthesis glycosyltransferase
LQNFSGRAIYLDSDMIVFRDIRGLWELPFQDAQLLAVPKHHGSALSAQFSVLLLDCNSLSWNVRDIVAAVDRKDYSYRQLMEEFPVADRIALTVPESWNSLERHEEEKTDLLHFTRVETQPWLSTTNPLGYLWFRYFFEALDENKLPFDLVTEHIRRGFLRPSLHWQIEHRLVDPREIPDNVISDLDANFSIPNFRKPSVLRRTGWFVTHAWKKAFNGKPR